MKRLILIIAMMLLGTPTVLAQNGHDLFQKALQKERAEGNLEAAIALYERIVEEHASDRALVAKALVQMGQDYERLGRTEEAQRVFATVANEYADQVETAQLARAKVVVARREAEVEDSGIVIRQVDFGTDLSDQAGAPTPDGRHLVMTDWSTGDLAVRDLASGEMHRLTHKGSWAESSAFALFPIPSRDGKRIAYAWFNDDDERYELRIVGRDGSTPHVLYRHEDITYIEPTAWSPDGKHVLALFSRSDQTNQIALVSTEGGTVRVLKTLDWRYPLNLSLSPDGRHVVYDFPPEEDRPERDLYLLAADGSRETRLVDHPANDLMPVWTPDGNHILFFSDRTGTLDAWLLPVVDGERRGASELVKTNMGAIAPMGFTREGAFYFGLRTQFHTVYVGELDPATEDFLEPPTEISRLFMGTNSQPEWSPDGRHLAYLSLRNRIGTSGTSVLVIHDFDTDEERELRPDLDDINGPISWSPGGQSLLIHSVDQKNRGGLYRIDVQTGEATLVRRDEPGTTSGQSLWSPEESAIFFTTRGNVSAPDEKHQSIVMRDLETGREQVLFQRTDGTHLRTLALSPDGQHLAFSMMDSDPPYGNRLMTMPAAGGEPQELLGLQERVLSLTWAPDGRDLFFSKPDSAFAGSNGPSSVWRIAAAGGVPQKLGLTMDLLINLRFHPDGQRIAFSAGEGKGEVWVMEGFLPDGEGTK